jgi:hypothetical protein
MTFSFRRWRPRHILFAWSAYWVGLVLVQLWPAIVAGWRMSQQADSHESANASMTDGILSANIIEAGHTTWAGSISVLTLAFLIAGPPLLLLLAWLADSSRTNHAEGKAVKNDKKVSELHAAEPRIGIVESPTSSTLKRRAREES